MKEQKNWGRIWGKLFLLATTCLIGWVGISHYAFDWAWSKSIVMGMCFYPFFFGFLGVAYFLPRMME